MTDPIGFIGLGKMGAPMVRCLAGAGHRIVGFDTSSTRRQALAGTPGVTVADCLSQCVQTRTLILMLPNGQIVKDVLIGSGNALEQLTRGALVIDMSSIDPTCYGDIEPVAERRSITIIDAPVSGNVSGAEAGTLTIMAGGSLHGLERAKSQFEAMARQVFHLGPLGAGQTMKAINNLMSAGGLILAIEALLVAKRAGIDPSLANTVLNGSTGRNNSTERKIEPFVLSGAFNSGFDLSLMTKDVVTAGEIARQLNLTAPLSNEVVRLARAADEALGPQRDHTAIALWLQEEMGVEL